MISSKGIKWQTRQGVLLPDYLAFTKQFDPEDNIASIFADLHISNAELWAVFDEHDKRGRGCVITIQRCAVVKYTRWHACNLFLVLVA